MIARRFDEALTQFTDVLREAPNQTLALNGRQNAFVQKKMHNEAFASERSLRAARGDEELVAALDRGNAQGGYRSAMLRAAETLAARAQTADVPAVNLASLYIRGGDYVHALDWLERAYVTRDPNLPYINVSPVYDALRADRRFQELVRRLKL